MCSSRQQYAAEFAGVLAEVLDPVLFAQVLETLADADTSNFTPLTALTCKSLEQAMDQEADDCAIPVGLDRSRHFFDLI